jgi:hypothetical protein
MDDFGKRFILQTDASGVALGAVLSQENDGFRQPIAFASRTLTNQERRASSTYKLECLAVLFGMEKFRKYLEHQEFVLQKDNQALSWLLAHPRQLGKIGRWTAKITAFKFEVRHIRGTQNNVADALSRMFEIPPLDAAVQEKCRVILTEIPSFSRFRKITGRGPVFGQYYCTNETGRGSTRIILEEGHTVLQEQQKRRQ